MGREHCCRDALPPGCSSSFSSGVTVWSTVLIEEEKTQSATSDLKGGRDGRNRFKDQCYIYALLERSRALDFVIFEKSVLKNGLEEPS